MTDHNAELQRQMDEALKERARDLTEAAQERREAKRPSIEHLEMGVAVAEVDGKEQLVPLFCEGDRVVVERRTELLAGAWLDTRVLTVQSIDDASGVVRCRDDEADQLTYVSYKSALHDIRLCPAKGDPFAAPKEKSPARDSVSPSSQAAGGERRGRGRGRPKGSKNRPKEVVEAERKERAEERGSRRRRAK
jgi:hypothetical protein